MTTYTPTTAEIVALVEDAICNRYCDVWGSITAAAHICPDQAEKISDGDIDVLGLVLNHDWDPDLWHVIIPEDATSIKDVWADYEGDMAPCSCAEYRQLVAEQREEGPLSPCCDAAVWMGSEGSKKCSNCEQRVELVER